MGYLIYADTRSRVITDLTQVDENDYRRIESLKHTLRGNVLWSVVKVTIKKVKDDNPNFEYKAGDSYLFIACYLLARVGGRWGYKEMDESMHPYYYTCPLSYLDMVPEVCSEWRANVRKYHEKSRQQRLNRCL